MFFQWLEDAARHHGTAHAVVQRDTYLSFRGLGHRAGRRMQELRALGLESGMALGVMLGNVADYVVLAVAANQLGVALVPLPPHASARELALALAALPLRAIVSRPGLRALEHDGVRLDGDPPLPAPTKRTRLQGSLLSCALFKAQEAPLLPPDTVLVHLGPGAAGRCEPVLRSAHALADEAERLAAALGTGDRLRIGVGLPLYQPFTLESTLALVCGYGAELYLDDDLAPRQVTQRAREASPSIMVVTRALLWSMASLTPPHTLSPGTRLLCVDGPVERDLDQAVHRALGVRPRGLLHRPGVGLVSLDTEGRAPHTVGTALAGVEVRLLGRRQTPVAAGRRGVLQVRHLPRGGEGAGGDRSAREGKNLVGVSQEGRMGRIVARAGAGTDPGPGSPWLDTGEEAALDPQGRLKLHGRADDHVLVGGLFVSLAEVREVLLAHPAVAEAEVSLAPPETPAALDGAALLVARVARREAVSLETLLAHLGRHLSPHKVPGRLELVGAQGRGRAAKGATRAPARRHGLMIRSWPPR